MPEKIPSRFTALRLARAAIFGLLLASVVGCGGTGSVTGTVSYKPKQKKLNWGSVTMIGKDGIAHGGLINSDGTYTVNGVPAGPVKIIVTSSNPRPPAATGAAAARETGPGGKKPGGAGAPTETAAVVPDEIVKAWFPIPDKYGDAEKTPLTTTVNRGPNTFDINLD